MGWHRALSAPVAPPDALHTASSGMSSLSVYIYCLEQPAMVRTPRMALAGRSGGSAPSTMTLCGCNGNDAVVSRDTQPTLLPRYAVTAFLP